MTRTLLVYYSRSGTTRRVALAIAQALEADVEEIVDETPRSGVLGYLRSIVDATLRRPASLQPPKLKPADYDVVIVGTPVWSARISSPVRTYLNRHCDGVREVAFFCTCGGRGGRSVLRQMKRLMQKTPVARLIVRERKVRRDTFAKPVERFAREVREAIAGIEGIKAGELAAKAPVAPPKSGNGKPARA